MLKISEPSPANVACDIPGIAVPESLLTDPDRFGGDRIGGCRVGTLKIAGGRVVGMSGGIVPTARLVLPKLCEPHVHLDKCHTIERLGPVGGDLAAASAAQREDKERWTQPDLETRMRRGLRELAKAGCGAVRTHIDWGDVADEPPLAWDVACGLRKEARELGMDLQVAALTDIDVMADTDVAQTVATRVAECGGVLGSFVLHHQKRDAGIENCIREADRHGLALDFHVDEGLDPALDGLALIEQAVRMHRFEGPVLCGHACSLASQPADQVTALGEKLAETGIAIVSLPSTNLYLQGRGTGTPKPRGLTMIQELQACGVDVCLGTDNVRDAFCPVGRHDPLHTLSLAVLGAHLDPPMAAHLPMITTTPRMAMGLTPKFVDEAKLEDLIAFDTPELSSLLSHPFPPTSLSTLALGGIDHG